MTTEASRAFSLLYAKERLGLIDLAPTMAGTNTINAGLQRQLILHEIVRDFARVIAPLRVFATAFKNAPLEGTNVVDIPFYPLQSSASSDFVAANGYVFSGTSTTNTVAVTVNKRKYQPLDYSSDTFRRQPWFNSVQLGRINAEKLAYDVAMDILSCVTLANFPNVGLNVGISGVTSDNIIDLRLAANTLNWPQTGRAIVASTSLESVLFKDPSIKLALNVGTPEVIQGGTLPRIFGFETHFMPAFPSNSIGLVGFACFASAIAAAFAPVAPAPGVAKIMAEYSVITDAETGISLNHRHWGSADMDTDREVIECSYGFSAMQSAALMPITSPN